ncbi:hypothetical protein CYMTET_9242 [Cymbomonas tetramitiformis]|uniref:Major facilitator superfamily (MFS) profile domain-containing protein n=1 Tax=Cymbomonas tetramitiformis TaxID=36881 RepID=A0AAE0GRG5_9CHLO|nr:hypothetical protein CYMTET_9242 [Cymbomonas tetramitiformis]
MQRIRSFRDVLVLPTTAHPAPTPIDAKLKLAIVVAIFSAGVATSMLFSMNYFMVSWTNVGQGSESRIGAYSGLLAGANPLGSAISGVFWGKISDRFGRRPAVLLSNVGGLICALWLGLSASYWSMLGARISSGLVNGLGVVLKTVIGEVCDETNQARGFSYISVGWGLGTAAGPTLGALLSEPCAEWGWFHAHRCPALLVDLPFLLPCCASALFCAIAVGICHVFLPETCPAILRQRDADYSSVADGETSGLLETDSDIEEDNPAGLPATSSGGAKVEDVIILLRSPLECTTDLDEASLSGPGIPSPSCAAFPATLDPALTTTKSALRETPLECSAMDNSHELNMHDMGRQHEEALSTAPAPLRNFDLGAVLRSTGAEVACTEKDEVLVDATEVELACLHEDCAGQEGLLTSAGPRLERETQDLAQEKMNSLSTRQLLREPGVAGTLAMNMLCAFILVLVTEVTPLYVAAPEEVGGLGASMQQLGLLLTAAGIVLLVYTYTVYPSLNRWLGPLKGLRFGLFTLAVVFIITPMASLAHWSGSQVLQWSILVLAVIGRNCAGPTCMTACSILISNGAPRTQLGQINGIAGSTMSASRGAGPMVGGCLWALAVAWHGIPGHQALPFVLLAILAVAGGVLSHLLPLSLLKPRS